jgi:hypothetical protein
VETGGHNFHRITRDGSVKMKCRDKKLPSTVLLLFLSSHTQTAGNSPFKLF